MICAEHIIPQPLKDLSKRIAPLTSKLTIFCDLDGPLIDVSERYYHTYQQALKATQTAFSLQSSTENLPINPLTKEQFWHMKQERLPDDQIALQSGLEAVQVEVFIKNVHQLVNQPTLLNKDHLQPGVRWALSLLKFSGARLSVVTLRRQAEAEQLLHQHGLGHMFDQICGVEIDDLAAYKNYTDCKQKLLSNVLARCHRLETKKAWMIGDTEADVLAGQAVGVSTIALTCGIRSRNYLTQLQPTQVHNNLLSATHYLLGCA
jgi:phosphoglycolate phosphatase